MKRLLVILSIICLTSCKNEFDLYPPDKLSPITSFNSESDLQLYANSFYNILPTGSSIARSDVFSDYIVNSTVNPYLSGSYNSSQSGGWSWTALRNINYFLAHFNQADIPEASLKHYEGLARFFRAWFYFDKVKQFGGVPWYSDVLDVNDTEGLYKPRDSREFVMSKILEDLNFAAANINPNKDATASLINKWVALGFKSRVCLYEGTFQKYQNGSLSSEWFTEAANAAEEVMNASGYQLNIESDLAMSYRNLFILEQPKTNEVMLATVNSQSLRVMNDANWVFTSATYAGRPSFTKTFINTFLMSDGTRFTDQSKYNEIPFWKEVENRDLRLKQTIRMSDYKREGILTPPEFVYTYTGYHPLKFTLDSKKTDGNAENSNSLPLMRYAEILLNYAEAKAELGIFNESDWNKTIRLLRARAGIDNSSMPVIADTYLQNTHYPDISDPALLEIRRERGIELSLEGFRYDDLMRWKQGDLLLRPYDGIYVPSMDTPLDLNQDGKDDVAFVSSTPANPVKGIFYYIVNGTQNRLSNGTSGILYTQINLHREFKEFQYLRPIPLNELTLNPALDQNPNWDN